MDALNARMVDLLATNTTSRKWRATPLRHDATLTKSRSRTQSVYRRMLTYDCLQSSPLSFCLKWKFVMHVLLNDSTAGLA